MRYLLIGLLFLNALPLTAQFGKTPKVAPSGSWNIGRRATDGVWTERGSSGSVTPIKVDPTVSNLTTYQPVASVRAWTLTTATAPKVLMLTDAAIGGEFRLDASDSSSPDNTGITIVTSSGLRYKRFLPEKRLTPDMFGAIPNDSGDDGAALQAWLSLMDYELYLPAGTYKSAQALSRVDKKGVLIQGAGSGLSKIDFTANTHGLAIRNTQASGNTGVLNLKGIEIISSGTKTGGKEALRLESQYEQRPGVNLYDVSVKGLIAANEWGKAIVLKDCYNVNFNSVDVQGATSNTTTGLFITNTSGFPADEYNFYAFNARTLKTGVEIQGVGNPNVEGVQFTDCNIVGVFDGIIAEASAGSPPYLGLKGVHINVFGGQVLRTNRYAQIMLAGCAFYSAPGAGGVVATSPVSFSNATTVTGDFFITTTGASANAVEFTGAGQGADLRVTAVVYDGVTNGVKIGAGYVDNTPDVHRIWGLGGSNTGVDVLDLSGSVRSPLRIPYADLTPTGGSLLRYETGVGYRATQPHKAISLSPVYVAATGTLSGAATNFFQIGNGATAITLTLDFSTFVTGQTVTLKRYDNNSTGTITIQSSGTGHLVQGLDGTLNATLLLPTTAGQRQVTLIWNGTHFELLSN